MTARGERAAGATQAIAATGTASTTVCAHSEIASESADSDRSRKHEKSKTNAHRDVDELDKVADEAHERKADGDSTADLEEL